MLFIAPTLMPTTESGHGQGRDAWVALPMQPISTRGSGTCNGFRAPARGMSHHRRDSQGKQQRQQRWRASIVSPPLLTRLLR